MMVRGSGLGKGKVSKQSLVEYEGVPAPPVVLPRRSAQ
jgi:hypothetical protein